MTKSHFDPHHAQAGFDDVVTPANIKLADGKSFDPHQLCKEANIGLDKFFDKSIKLG